MNCERFDAIQASGDVGNLLLQERLEFERHMAECAPCVRRLREVILTTEMLKRLEAYEGAESPLPLRERLVQRILAARRSATADERIDRRAV